MSKQIQEDGTEKPYYIKVSENKLDKAKDMLQQLLEEGYDNKYITKEELDAMKPDEDKGPGMFYCNFKVHKP